MENASKALLMAGGVLIAMMIMAIGIYLFTQYSQMGNQYTARMSEQETVNFNSNFTVFENRENVTAQEIASLTNFVNDYKEKTDVEVKVYVNGSQLANYLEFVKKNSSDESGNAIYYRCNKIEYEGPFDTVSLISFVKN